MRKFDSVFTKLVTLLGIFEIIGSIIIYPKVGLINLIINSNKNDILQDFSFILLSLGIFTILINLITIKKKSSISTNISLLLVSMSLILIVDRLLLIKFGVPLWQFDKELHYVHRPNKKAFWSNGKIIVTNELGFHDDKIIKKRKKEYRIFNIGDSIVMGHEVEKHETFSYLLKNQPIKNSDSLIINSINLGVQGYSTFQYLITLKRYLFLNPDHALISLCLNDLTEPYKVNKKYGGIGYDYHQVEQISSVFVAYIFNETGIGRLSQKIRYNELLKNFNRESELKDIFNIMKNGDDSRYIYVWKNHFSDIQTIKNIAQFNNINLTFLIFPYTFQFFNESLNYPQMKIKKYLDSIGLDYLDILEEFESYIKNTSTNKEDFIKNHYIDENHLSPNGHKLVANIIYERVFN